jgi:hypothetical protein
MTDFIISLHGSVCILTPRNDAAREWLDENIAEDALTWGPDSIVIEPRYAEPILMGLQDDGLTVST